MINSTNRKSYFYSGPVYRFNDIVKKNWTGGTTALSEKQALSNLKRKCPHCGSILAPSDVEGYAYVCHECDENFCHFEVDEISEWRGGNVMMVSD